MRKHYTRKPIEYQVDANGCHNVISHQIDTKGYPRIKRNGKDHRIHRYIYAEAHGPIDPSLVVRHKCDNRLCINLDHLELGTHQDNIDDMVQRGRHKPGFMPGETNPRAILTEDQVREIKSDSTSTNTALGKKYGVHHSMISAIRLGKNWKHII